MFTGSSTITAALLVSGGKSGTGYFTKGSSPFGSLPKIASAMRNAVSGSTSPAMISAALFGM